MSRSEGFILPLMLILMLILSLLTLTLFEAEQTHLALFGMVEESLKQNPSIPTAPDHTFTLRMKDPNTGDQYWQKEIDGFEVTLLCPPEKPCLVINLHPKG